MFGGGYPVPPYGVVPGGLKLGLQGFPIHRPQEPLYGALGIRKVPALVAKGINVGGARLNQIAAPVLQVLSDGPAVGGDHRGAAGHGLQHRIAQALGLGGQQEGVRAHKG